MQSIVFVMTGKILDYRGVRIFYSSALTLNKRALDFCFGSLPLESTDPANGWFGARPNLFLTSLLLGKGLLSLKQSVPFRVTAVHHASSLDRRTWQTGLVLWRYRE